MNPHWRSFLEGQGAHIQQNKVLFFDAPENEKNTVEQNAYLTDLSSLSLISIAGPDAEKFLQGQLTCNISDLENKAAFAACCDHKGRIQANFWIWRQQPNEYLLLLPSAMIASLIEHLKKYAIFSKVQLTTMDENWIAFVFSSPTVHTIGTSIVFPTEIHDMSFNTDCVCIKIPGNHHRFLFLGNYKNLQSTWDQLTTAAQPVGSFAWQLENILTGIALIDPQTKDLFTPQMINLDQWGGVSFTKGCYVGQEVIARTQHLGILKRHLCRGELAKAMLPISSGDAIVDPHDETLGIVIESLSHPHLPTQFLTVMQDRAWEEKSHPLRLKKLPEESILHLQKFSASRG